MKIVIEVLVDIDAPVTASERKALKKHVAEGLSEALVELDKKLGGEPRMLDSICRFRFGYPTAKVE